MIEYLFWFTVLIIVYTYFGYPILLTILTARYRRMRPVNKEDDHRYQPVVSLIIPAHNEEKDIGEKIENSLALKYPDNKLELILVSDGSTDKTNQIIDSFQKKSNRVKFIHYPVRQGKAHALNSAVNEAQGEILVFSDANVWYKPDAIEQIVRYFTEPAVGCVCGEVQLYSGEIASAEGEGLYSIYERSIQKKESMLATMVAVDGAMFAIRRHLFSPIPADTVVEDYYIALKCVEQKFRIVYAAEAKGKEEVAFSIREEVKRKIRMIAGGFQVLARMPWLLNPFHDLLVAVEFISHKFLRWLLPFPLMVIFLTNTILLVGKNNLIIYKPIYVFTFIIQFALYSGAFLGLISCNLRKNRLLHFSTYFCAVNAAAVIGLYRYLFRKQQVTWEKVTR